MRREWWSGGWRAATCLGVALAAACNGSGASGAPAGGDASAPDTASDDASSDDASSDDASDANAATEADAAADAGDASSGCSSDGAIVAAGDYVAAGGTQYWLRRSATAATFTIVPGGTPSASSPPSLARIQRVCPSWLGVAGTDESTRGDASPVSTFARLDWATVTGGLLLCQRAASSLDAAASLAAANPQDTAAGCGGAAWLSLTPVSP